MATARQPATGASLISADRVEGTSVYNRTGDHLGSIKDVMIDKMSGKVAYAVMSFGGFLGIGEKLHPVPWSKLNYDRSQGGYVVDMDKRVLEGALTRDCLGPRERDRYQVRFTRSAFVRVNHATLISTIVQQIAAGLLTVDEGRALLERPPADATEETSA